MGCAGVASFLMIAVPQPPDTFEKHIKPADHLVQPCSD